MTFTRFLLGFLFLVLGTPFLLVGFLLGIVVYFVLVGYGFGSDFINAIFKNCEEAQNPNPGSGPTS